MRVKIKVEKICNSIIEAPDKLMLLSIENSDYYQGIYISFYKTTLKGKYLMVYKEHDSDTGPDFYERICDINEVQKIFLNSLFNSFISPRSEKYSSLVYDEDIQGTINITKANYENGEAMCKYDHNDSIVVSMSEDPFLLYYKIYDYKPFSKDMQNIFKAMKSKEELTIYV